MKTYNLSPSEKNLVETFLKDSIGRTNDVCSFSKLIQETEDGCSISIDGQWGTGKTFFVKQSKLVLDALNPNVSFSESESAKRIKRKYEEIIGNQEDNPVPIVTVYYDAWQHDDEDDPLLSVVYEIMKDNYNNCSDEIVRIWVDILASIADVVSDRNITNLLKELKGKNIFEEQKENDDLSQIINRFLDSFLPERGNKLVVFIDELDRCSPVYAVKLLERIKHYFLNENVIFVFSVNAVELQKTIRKFYGDDFDACRYLDRFFDVRPSIPPFDIRRYLSCIGLSDSRNLRETVCFEVINQMNMEMREISHFMHMSKMAAFKFTDGDLRKVQRYNSIDNGVEKIIAFDVILPLAIGLKMNKSEDYEDFISGKNRMWLERILMSERIGDRVLGMLLAEGESYSNINGRVLVNKEDKIKALYTAVFVERYEGSKYQTVIGEAYFDKETKNSIIRAMGLISPFSDISV